MKTHQIIAERLRAELAERGLSAVELARAAGVKTSFLYDILNGKSLNPSSVKLGQAAHALGVSLAWLSGLETGRHQQPDAPEEHVRIPRITVHASAGPGAIAESEQAEEHYYFRRSWIRDKLRAMPEHLRMMYIRGDSMAPTLQDGDIILIDTQRRQPSPPGIFVLDDGVGIVAKRLEMAGSTPPVLRILSDNPQYSPYERELREARIIGRVVWFAREI
jgi:phage repressor protein C with HTH and peptisase S24 domain